MNAPTPFNTLQPATVPPLLRHGTPAQYALLDQQQRAQRAAQVDAAMQAAAPVVEAVEALLNKGFPLHRLMSESGVSAPDTRRLLERVKPHEAGAIDYGWSDGQMRAACARWAAWLAESPVAALRSAKLAPLPTHKAIYNLIADAQRAKRLLVIVGGFGVGKSCAAEAVAMARPRSHGAPGVVKVELRESDRSAQRMLEHIYFGITHRERYPMRGAVMGELCKLLRPGDVLVLDECQRLAGCANGSGVELVRELFDHCAGSIVLMGNEAMRTRANVLDRSLYGALISRARIYDREFLQLSEDDIDVFMAWKGLSGIELRRELVDIAIRQDGRPGSRHGVALVGGLRLIADLCERAAEANPGRPITGLMVRAIVGGAG